MKEVKCPDCCQLVSRDSIRSHILICKSYQAKLYENTCKLADCLSTPHLQFLIAEVDMVKDLLQARVIEKQPSQQNGACRTQAINPEHALQSLGPLDFDNLIERKTDKNMRQKLNGNLVSQPSPFPSPFPSPSPPPEPNGEAHAMACVKCGKKMGSECLSEVVFVEPCCHTCCLSCVRSYIEEEYVAKKGGLECLEKECHESMMVGQIREAVGGEALEKMEKRVLREMMNLVVCFKCKQEFELEAGSPEAPRGEDKDRKMERKHAVHFAENRFVCPNSSCKQEQCRSCHSVPYHLGRTCSEHQEFQALKKCRYCATPLPKGYTSTMGIKAFHDICDSSHCKKTAANACAKIHPCQHPCMGYIRESPCLPCLKECCAKGGVAHGQDEHSYCSVCYIEDLKSSPCVMGKCGHIFHYCCLEKRLEIRWLTPRITFEFCLCPLCKQWISLGEECPLAGRLAANAQVCSLIKEKALLRLRSEKLDQDHKLTDPSSQYYGRESEYALSLFTYFECHKCRKPYFGGRKSCADAMGQRADGREQQFDPSKLICAECCPIPTKDCPSHGKEFISFKCKFCCNISLWFCWGNTHFCDICHQKQLKGIYVSKIPREELPKCEGPAKCPSGGEHPSNGQQCNLGCLLCRNYKQHHRESL